MKPEIEPVLDGLAELSGLMVLWKQANGSGCGLAERHTYHDCEFCRAVKADPARLALCSRNDSELLAKEAESVRRPFLHRCHAGVVELATPLFEEGNCRELVLAGIFREAGDGTPYPDCAEAFARLPFRAAVAVDPLGATLAALAPMLRERRDARRRDDVARTVKDSRIAAAAAAIRRHPGGRFTAGELARKACLSESHFIHLFRRETGVAFSEFVNRERLREAERLLRETDLPLLRIALECGFHDQSHFGGRFRKATNFTPLNYRRRFGESHDI